MQPSEAVIARRGVTGSSSLNRLHKGGSASMTRIAAHHAAAMHKVMVRRATQHGMLQEASKQVAAHYGRPHVGAKCIRSQLSRYEVWQTYRRISSSVRLQIAAVGRDGPEAPDELARCASGFRHLCNTKLFQALWNDHASSTLCCSATAQHAMLHCQGSVKYTSPG